MGLGQTTAAPSGKTPVNSIRARITENNGRLRNLAEELDLLFNNLGLPLPDTTTHPEPPIEDNLVGDVQSYTQAVEAITAILSRSR